MKRIILLLATIYQVSIGLAQNEFKVKINKTELIDSTNFFLIKPKEITNPPADPDFNFENEEFVNKIVSTFEYWDTFLEDYQTTLYIYPNSKNSSDSILVAKDENNTFYFKKVNNTWQIKNFNIKDHHFTLKQIHCGQTSNEVFKFLGEKIKKPVGNGHVFISDKKGNNLFILTFSKDKLTSIQY